MIKWGIILLLGIPRVIYSTIKLKIMNANPKKYSLQARYNVLRATVWWIVKLTRVDLNAINKDIITSKHENGRLYVSNHRHIFDILILIYLSEKPLVVISKKENIKVPFLAAHAKAIDVLFIDRGDVRQSLKVCKEAGNLIQNGKDIVIFAEGTRTKDGEVAPFKAALSSIVSYSKGEFVLLCMHNTEYPLKWKWITYPKVKVNVKFFEPLGYDYFISNRKNFAELTRDMVQNQLEEFRKGEK